jgi:hypothetical protein
MAMGRDAVKLARERERLQAFIAAFPHTFFFDIIVFVLVALHIYAMWYPFPHVAEHACPLLVRTSFSLR